jgi:hypothetical protein
MKGLILAMSLAVTTFAAEPLTTVKRVYVDKLTGDNTAAQIRDLLIAALENTKLFTLTENPDRADAILRGAAEDLVYTDTFQSSDSIDARASIGASGSTRSGNRTGPASLSVGENESTRIAERKHEAFATVRLVNKDGDVIWSTTQESTGAKFRSASADVADRVARQLKTDIEKVKK